MHYPKLALRLFLYFLILISLSFCRERKTGFIIPMEGANTYECFLDHKPEPFCSIQKKDIPYGEQITYYPKEIKIKENEVYYESKYEGETTFIKANVIGSEPKKYYFKVFPLQGVSLLSKDDKEIQKIAYGEKVEFISIHNFVRSEYIVKFKDKEGILKEHDLIESKGKVYFKVSTISGLNLRESSDMKSKIIVTLPYQTVGEVIEADKTVYTIQDRKGYWVKTSYENKVGWLFSGFVFVSSDKDKFRDEEEDREQWFFNYFKELKEWEPIRAEYNSSRMNESEDSSLLNGFRFIEEKNKGTDECSENSKLFFVNSGKDFFYDLTIGVESYKSKDYGKIFFMRYEGCHCCCSYWGELIVFVLRNRLFSHSVSSDAAMGGYLQNEKCWTKIQNIKYSKQNSMAYIYAMYGDCEMKYTEMDRIEVFKSFTHDIFIKIKINEDDLDIKRIIDKGIPAEYKQEWEEAKEIWKKRD